MLPSHAANEGTGRHVRRACQDVSAIGWQPGELNRAAERRPAANVACDPAAATNDVPRRTRAA
eukprot:3292466-Prymnesium_polylepis.1